LGIGILLIFIRKGGVKNIRLSIKRWRKSLSTGLDESMPLSAFLNIQTNHAAIGTDKATKTESLRVSGLCAKACRYGAIACLGEQTLVFTELCHACGGCMLVCPVDAIREELEHYDWEQKDLAEIMGRSEKNISELVKNKTPITYDTALQLAKSFKQTPQFWLNLDAAYRQRMQETAKFKDTEARALIYRYMPVRELRKRINLPKKVDELVAAVKKFWRIEELEFGFLDEQVAACFRKSDAYRNFNPYFALTWLQLARNSELSCQKIVANHVPA